MSSSRSSLCAATHYRKQIAATLALSPATVSRVLRKARLSRMRDLDPPESVRRYEREPPGELIHIDIKKLGRFERVGHRITGDRPGRLKQPGHRLGVRPRLHRRCLAQILPDEKKESAVAFLHAAIAHYKNLGIIITRVMTDNG